MAACADTTFTERPIRSELARNEMEVRPLISYINNNEYVLPKCEKCSAISRKLMRGARVIRVQLGYLCAYGGTDTRRWRRFATII